MGGDYYNNIQGCQLYPIKVSNAGGFPSFANVLTGIYHGVIAGVKIFNCSFGFDLPYILLSMMSLNI